MRIVAIALLLAATRVDAAPPCGVRDDHAREPTAKDALFVLRAAIGIPGLCGPCTCDVDRSGAVTAVDAAMVLNAAVGTGIVLDCPVCPCRAAPRIDAGFSPRSVAVVDVDDDSHVDLVTSNTESDDVSVVHGTGRGRFGRHATFWVGETPLSAVVADLDGDGVEDIVTTNALPGDLTILRGKEDGSFGVFGEELRIQAGIAPINAAAADVDGDTVLDLVVANSLSHDISVLLGNGDATFRTFVRVAVGRGPRWVGVADLDGDQIFDAVTANRDSNDITVLSGRSDGSFVEKTLIETAAGPYYVEITDMNGDSVLDLVVANYYAEGVSIALGQGDATFAIPMFYPTGTSAIALTTSDLDRDGLRDVAVAALPRFVSVLRGVGDGALAPSVTIDSLGGPRAIVAHDIDEDGNEDLLVAGSLSHDVNVLHGRGDGTFVGERTTPAARYAVATAVADFNRDGHLDIALAGQRYWMSTHLGNGEGNFLQGTRVPTRRSPQVVLARDVDGDAVDDLVFVSNPYCWDECYDEEPYLPYVSCFFSTSDGTLSEELIVPNLNASVIAVGDVDGDQRADIVAEDHAAPGLLVLRSEGRGGFIPDGRVVTNEVTALELSDIDSDGHLDLLWVEAATGKIGVASGTGQATFATPAFYDGGTGPSAIVVGDVNADGRVDLVVPNGTSRDVSVLLGTKNGSFASQIRSAVGDPLNAAHLFDLDRDHALDLVGTRGGKAYAMRGDGRGRFSEPVVIVGNAPSATARGAVSALAVGTFAGDILPEAIGVNSTMAAPTFVVVPRAAACLIP